MAEAKKEIELKVKDGIGLATFGNWKEYLDWVSKQEYSDWLFRGQKDVVPIIPTIYRDENFRSCFSDGDDNDYLSAILEESSNADIATERMNRQLKIFQKGMQGQCNLDYSKHKTADEEWWCLGRHHGLKTPLLDWTYSVGVALFFCFCEKKDLLDEGDFKKNKFRAVIVLKQREIEKIIKDHKSEYFDAKDIGKIKLDDYSLRFIEALSHHNKNMIAQQGAFTMMPMLKRKKDLSLVSVGRWCTVFCSGVNDWFFGGIAIRENEDDREKCLKYLNSMNINYKTLFPGPEGAAKHANLCLEIPGYA